MMVPCRIGIGGGVRIRKRSHGGVSASRLQASAKNAKESSTDNATSWERSMLRGGSDMVETGGSARKRS